MQRRNREGPARTESGEPAPRRRLFVVRMPGELVPEGLRKAHGAIREFLPMLPQVINHSVCPSRDFRHLGSLVRRHVENLDATRCNFHLMGVEMPMPLNGGELS